ncbi:Major Facilitator Superfamily [Popillia japonica]|uniref:Major Facilitator Superfamily n=1 Tax=Popillia japonica TaxID=7064 RepID=A0AAW1HQZ5_POPJA
MELKHKLYIIYTISFLDLFAIGLMFPLLYPHIRELGGSHFIIGLLGSMYSALQVLTGPLIGSWSDIRGRRFVLLTTLTICTICYFLLGLTSSIFFVFILRMILGFIKHTQTICKALIADSLPIEQQAAAYGQSSGYGMLGFVIGPILGGHISEMNNGFFYVCCFTSFLFVINMTLALILPDSPKTTDKFSNISVLSLLSTIHKEFLRAIRELLKINWKIYWDTFLMRFLFAISVSIMHSSHSLYLKEKYNLSQVNIGYTISFLSIIGVICGLSMGKITKIFYKNDHNCLQRIYHSFCVMAACSVGFYLAPDLYTFYAILVPFAISSTLLRIVTMELMITKSKNDEKGSLSGASNSVMSIARFITPLSSGIIGDIFGENTVMLSGLVPALTGSLVCVYLTRRSKIKGN